MKYLVLLLVLVGCGVNSDSLRVGYCPTMTSYVEQIPSVIPVEFESASQAITALQNGKVDVIVIGRKAYSFENQGFSEVLLEDGYTLVGLERAIVSLEDLELIRTCSFEEVDYPFGNVTVINTLQEECQTFLIRWSQFNDQNLIIPEVDGEKISWFRSPHFYAREQNTLNKIFE